MIADLVGWLIKALGLEKKALRAKEAVMPLYRTAGKALGFAMDVERKYSPIRHFPYKEIPSMRERAWGWVTEQFSANAAHIALIGIVYNLVTPTPPHRTALPLPPTPPHCPNPTAWY